MGLKLVTIKNEPNVVDSSNQSWEKYHPSKPGSAKFCYYLSRPGSELPIRKGRKGEPYFEDKTYNEKSFCNQRGIRSKKASYLIFITRYKGKKKNYKNGVFITGFFPIDYFKQVIHPWKKSKKGVAFKSDTVKFLSIEDSINLKEKWEIWFKTPLPNNIRHMAKFLDVKKYKSVIEEIKTHFSNKPNAIENYIEEIKRS
tara:strand:- start:3025 stop:3621 length:597 start_codon:yes stop_codon:yes gene_type:complete